jgi:hypothetical protein
MGTLLYFKRTDQAKIIDLAEKLDAASAQLDVFMKKCIDANLTLKQKLELERIQRNKRVLEYYRIKKEKK